MLRVLQEFGPRHTRIPVSYCKRPATYSIIPAKGCASLSSRSQPFEAQSSRDCIPNHYQAEDRRGIDSAPVWVEEECASPVVIPQTRANKLLEHSATRLEINGSQIPRGNRASLTSPIHIGHSASERQFEDTNALLLARPDLMTEIAAILLFDDIDTREAGFGSRVGEDMMPPVVLNKYRIDTCPFSVSIRMLETRRNTDGAHVMYR